jgi:regulator of nucleoside diphosphate kinase
MSDPIILTTGTYDLIKDQIHRKRVSPAAESRLLAELSTAKQVLRRDLPKGIVTVDRVVKIKNLDSRTDHSYHFVGVGKGRLSKQKFAIDCEMALATLGRKQGDIIEWPFKNGNSRIEILEVSEV